MIKFSLRMMLRGPLLLSAISVLTIGGARATDRVGDAQAQAQHILSGTTAAVRSSAAVSHRDPSRSVGDPQGQARNVVLGIPNGGGAKVAVAPPSKTPLPAGVIRLGHGRARADAQEMARRVIMGKSA